MVGKVLVTGGAGFIGSNFVRFLLASDRNVCTFNLDALTYAGSLENLRDLPDPERHTFIHGDICDEVLTLQLLREHHIDTIVNFAAESHVDRSILGPRPFMRTNVMGVLSLLEAARRVWLDERRWGEGECRFHQISTDEVFGSLGPEDCPADEASPYAPSSPYAASKAAADHLVRAYANTYGLPTLITNCSNNYGPYQFPEKLIPLVIHNALRGAPLPIYGDGKQIRDWLYVGDHVEAIALILAGGRVGETYNIAGGVQPTNLDIVEQLCDLLDEMVPESPHVPHKALIQLIPDRPGHDRRYALGTTKINTEMAWRPRTSLDVGLRETVRWYLEHSEWTQRIHTNHRYQDWLTQNYAVGEVEA